MLKVPTPGRRPARELRVVGFDTPAERRRTTYWSRLRATYLENTNYDVTIMIDGEIVTNSTIRSRGSTARPQRMMRSGRSSESSK
jgi:hypothetical protein